MRTPAGSDCPFYFEDYFRGRQLQECRLLARTPGAGRWAPDLCKQQGRENGMRCQLEGSAIASRQST